MVTASQNCKEKNRKRFVLASGQAIERPCTENKTAKLIGNMWKLKRPLGEKSES